MPKLTIDGVEVEVPKGTSLIEAAKKANIDVPFYCYHPGLSVAGNCRMCLVEVEKMPKLQISCHIQAADGMVVHTNNDRVKQTRKHVLEFLLLNHPVDCPVCDQAGECWLQDYYMKHGAYESRLNEGKLQKPKAVPVGPNVMLDAERCILCSRCVRFCDEVSKTSELGIVNRGDHSEIQVFPDTELDNPYSGNVVDICPVGALTDRDFRFKMRVWYLKSEDTLCNGCSRGCNISMQYKTGRTHHAKGERVMRLKPRFNEEVNKWWMCDEGRYGYKYHDHNRILEPVKRSAGQVSEVSWDDSLTEVANLLERSEGNYGIFLSPQLSNEELYLAQKFFQNELKAKHVLLVSPKENGFEDDLLIRADKNPNTKGAELLGLKADQTALESFYSKVEKGEVEGIVVFGQDLLTLHGTHLGEKALNQLKWSVFIGSSHNLLSEYAGHALPAATYAEKEGTFTNFEGRTQKFNRVLNPLGESQPEWQILIDLSKRMGIDLGFFNEEDIFNELALKFEAFKGLSYSLLDPSDPDMRKQAAPMIPSLEQDSGLIFYDAMPDQSKPLETEKSSKV